MTAEAPVAVRFHFDPACPWAYQGSKWIREVEEVRNISVDWRLFSLTLVNAQANDRLVDEHDDGLVALRTLALVRSEAGNEGVSRVYAAIGDRTHERGTRLARSAVEDALEGCGFDVGLVDKAIDDETTMQTVRREHDAAVAEVGAFGVPTIVLPNGRGMFGPVLAVAPTGERAGELWDHVEWLIEQRDFFELKRERDRGPGETG